MADFFKNVKDWHILTLLGLIVLGYILFEYCGKQNLSVNNFQQMMTPHQLDQNSNLNNSDSVSASNNYSGDTIITDDRAYQPQFTGRPERPSTAAANLLPLPSENNFGHPVTRGFGGINLLNQPAGANIGMQASVMRNSNLQLRADPMIRPPVIKTIDEMTCLCAPASTIERVDVGLKDC